jgi:hypothetical protein
MPATPPAPVQRQQPATGSFKLPDGYQSLITINPYPAIAFWEKSVKPPGIDGKEAIDTTTMLNLAWRTFHSRSLKTLTEAGGKVAYDPNVIPVLFDIINVDTTFTYEWPDQGTLAFYAFLQSFEFDDLEEGKFPEATIKITPTNYYFDPSTSTYYEEGPVWTHGSGTSTPPNTGV